MSDEPTTTDEDAAGVDRPYKGIGEWRAQARKVEQPHSGWDPPEDKEP